MDNWTLLFASAAHDSDPGFRESLRSVMQQGLYWAGMIGLVNTFCYVAINVLVLDRPMALTPEPPVEQSVVLLIDDVYMVVVSLLYLLLGWKGCSLRAGRILTALVLLLGGAVMLYDDILYGRTIQSPGFISMIYMVAVIAIPFRPLQVLALGVGIAGIIVSPTLIGAVHMLEHLPVIGVAAALMTGISVLLYNNRWSEYSARRETQKALDEHQLLLNTTQEVGNIGGWQLDLVDDTLSCTRQIYRIYERSPETTITFDTLSAPIRDGANATFRSAVSRCIQTGEPFELELPLDVGRGKWVEVRGSAVRRDGEVVEVAGTLQDVTNRHSMEAELRSGRATIRSLYGAMENLLRARSRADVAVQIERLVRDTLAYPITAIRFFENGILVPVDQSGQVHENGQGSENGSIWPSYHITGDSYVAEAYCTGETLHVRETWIGTPSGTDAPPVRSMVYVPLAGHGVISVGSHEPDGITDLDVQLLEILAGNAAVVLDRTHQVQALVAAKEQAEEANRLKSVFLANMRHEIRTPLTSIIGFAEMIGETQCEDASRGENTDILHFSRLIEKSGKRLFQTLNSVLDFSRLEAGSMPIQPAPVDVCDEVAFVVEEYQEKAGEAGVNLVLDLPATEVDMTVDRGALRRILDSLLSNAVKFTDVDGTVTVRVHTESDNVLIDVEDTGIGIDDAFVPYLFEAFRQESTGVSRDYQGNGLGLAIAHRLAVLMEGRIDVETAKDEGTCFTVVLPRTHAVPVGD